MHEMELFFPYTCKTILGMDSFGIDQEYGPRTTLLTGNNMNCISIKKERIY